MNNINDARVQFEAWALHEGFYASVGLKPGDKRRYPAAVQWAWRAYQAALATSSAPPAAVPEGMILVDKEDLTDVCLDLLNLVDVTQFSKTRAERDKSVAHKLLELLTNE